MTGKELSFHDYMRLALYHPRHGYYVQAVNPIGAMGDFVTSSKLSPAFGFAVGRLAQEFVRRVGDEVCSIVDIGCGDGSLIAQVAEILESSPGRAHCFGIDQSIGRVPAALGEQAGLTFGTSLASVSKQGPMLLFSNELFDAFPVARLVQRKESLNELLVTNHGDSLSWSERPAGAEFMAYLSDRRVRLEVGQFADVSLEWESFYAELAKTLRRGLIVTIDYGFESRQLFDPRIRRYGTVASYAGHQVSRDVLSRPGEQDLTAHVNFSDLRGAGERHGLATLLFTRQARFLLSLGITLHPLYTPSHEVVAAGLQQSMDLLEARQAAQRLVLPDEMGEEMRVLVQAKGVDMEGWSFQHP